MPDRTAITVNGIVVRLYEDVLQRILRKHGELRGMETQILETVHSPELVLDGHEKELLALRR